MNILQVITKSDPIGGAQVVLLNLVNCFKENHEITVIVGEHGKLTEELEKIDVKFIVVKSLIRTISPINDIRAFIELKKIIKKINPDIVASHSTKAGYITRLICKQLKQPNVFTVHGWAFTEGVPYLKKKIFLNFERVASLFTDYLIAVSDFDRKLGISNKIVKPDRIKTIHNGVPDFSDFDETKRMNSIEFKGVMVARFQSQKDHNTLFRALSQLIEKNIKIDLVGDGPLLEQAKELSNKIGIGKMVEFNGVQRNIGKYLNRSDFFILITNYEGFPLTIIEAMSCGLPIIATDVGGINESIINGNNGLLVKRADVKSIKEAILYFYNNRQILSKYSENSRNRYLKNFTVDIMAEKTMKFYKEIINK